VMLSGLERDECIRESIESSTSYNIVVVLSLNNSLPSVPSRQRELRLMVVPL